MKKFQVVTHYDNVPFFERSVDRNPYVTINLIQFLPAREVRMYVVCRSVADLADVFDEYVHETER